MGCMRQNTKHPFFRTAKLGPHPTYQSGECCIWPINQAHNVLLQRDLGCVLSLSGPKRDLNGAEIRMRGQNWTLNKMGSSSRANGNERYQFWQGWRIGVERGKNTCDGMKFSCLLREFWYYSMDYLSLLSMNLATSFFKQWPHCWVFDPVLTCSFGRY